MKEKDWEVRKYGFIVDDYETCVEGKHIREKIYKYEGKVYVETWYNGIRLLFCELCDYRIGGIKE